MEHQLTEPLIGYETPEIDSGDGIDDTSSNHVKIAPNKDNNKEHDLEDHNSVVEGTSDENSNKRRPLVTGLSLEQKKTNHILSENRRRAQIRSSFDKLVELVPQLDSNESRSEYAVLSKTADYISYLREENARLEELRISRGL